MKKFLLTIGILCALGIPVAGAQNYAVSPAVKDLLDRADIGMAAGTQQGVMGFIFNTAFGEWSRMMLGPAMERIDTRLNVIERARERMDRTTCFQMDITLLEAKIEEVRLKMNAALDAGDIIEMQQLAALFLFLDERSQLLLQGGLNPQVSDWESQERQVFDALQPPEGPVCYYHSDYTSPGFIPPGRDGYGCDRETLTRILAEWDGAGPLREDLERELTLTSALQTAGESYLGDMELITDDEEEIEDIAAGEPTDTPAIVVREHLSENGCLDEASEGVVLNSRNGVFSVSPDYMRLSSEYRTLRRNAEADRWFPQRLVFFNDPGQWMWNVLRGSEQRLLSIFTRTQAVQEADTFMASADVVLSTEQGLQGVNAAITRLGNLTRDMNGIRGFTRDFAFHLLRSCIERPCQERLQRILRMVFKNECFPYFSGAYLTDTAESPRWEKCAEAASIESSAGTSSGPISQCPPVITGCLNQYSACIVSTENICGVDLGPTIQNWCSAYNGGLPPENSPSPPTLPPDPVCLAQASKCATDYATCRAHVEAVCVTPADITLVTGKMNAWCTNPQAGL